MFESKVKFIFTEEFLLGLGFHVSNIENGVYSSSDTGGQEHNCEIKTFSTNTGHHLKLGICSQVLNGKSLKYGITEEEFINLIK